VKRLGLAVALWSTVCVAQQLDGGAPLDLVPMLRPVDAPIAVELKPRFNVLLPIIEAEGLHFALAAINNLVLRSDFAQISLDSIASHFDGRRPWFFDVDSFVINQFGHPYQGSLAFTAARSAGLSFWWAAIYPFMASLTWELAFEIDAPSYNDQITTPVGGVFLGEVLHRSALLFLRDHTAPKWARVLGAFLIEPVGQLNRTMLGGEQDPNDVEDDPHYFALLAGGVNLGSAYRDPNTFDVIKSVSPQANVQGRLTYGIPGDPTFHYGTPFSHFDLDFNVSFPGTPVTSLFMRGLLYGWQFHSVSGDTRGVWGIFGQYDFASAALVQVSSVGLGVGTSFQTRLSRSWFLQLGVIGSGVPYSSAGSRGITDPNARDYHIGPGAQVTMEARLIWREVGWLRVVARSWYMVGAYVPPTGSESITYLTAGPLVRVWGPLAIGADAVVAVRRAKFPDVLYDPNLEGVTARITLNWISSPSLGAVSH
jgi:hypothetical protein